VSGPIAPLCRCAAGEAIGTGQMVAVVVGVGLVNLLYPDAGRAADDIVTPHTETTGAPS
jgi:hypothetical protein